MKKGFYLMILLVAAALAVSVSCDGNPAGGGSGAGGSIDPKAVGTWSRSDSMATETYTFNSDGSYSYIYDYKDPNPKDIAESGTWRIEDGMLRIDWNSTTGNSGFGDCYLFMRDGADGKKEIALNNTAKMPHDACFNEYTVNGNEYRLESTVDDENVIRVAKHVLSIAFPNYTEEYYLSDDPKTSDNRRKDYYKYSTTLTLPEEGDAYTYKLNEVPHITFWVACSYKVAGDTLTIGEHLYSRQ